MIIEIKYAELLIEQGTGEAGGAAEWHTTEAI